MIGQKSSKPTQDGIGSRVTRGAFLTLINFGGTSGLRLLSNLILTRLLFPEAFGLMALIQVVIAGATMFSDFGIREAIIQDKRGEEQAFIDTAWTLQIIRGFILGAIIYMAAGPISVFFDAPQLGQMLHFSAVIPVLQGFNSIGMHTANKQLLLGRLTLLALSSQILGLVAMVGLAYWLESVWALVYGTMITTLAHTVLSHVWLPLRTSWFVLEGDAVIRMFHYGKFIFFATVAAFFENQGDKLVLGKFIALDQLAIYNIAFFLATVPLLLAFAVTDKVFFPLYAHKPPSESPENKKKIDKARFVFSGALFFGVALLALIGDWLIRFLYDERYYAAGPVLVLIALASMPRLIALSYEKVPLAFGDSKSFAIYKVSTAFLQFGLTVFGVQKFGLVAAVFAPAITAVIAYPFLIRIAIKHKAWSPVHDGLFAGLTVIIAILTMLFYGNLLQDVSS